MKLFIFAAFSFHLFAYGEKVIPVCKRTPQVRDAIVKKLKVFVDSQIDCTLADGLLDQVYSLDLEHKGIELLKVGDFSGLASLDLLLFGYNNVSDLPSGIFSGLISLRWLHLRRNKLSALPVGIFSGLTSLRLLDLQHNNLSNLPSGIFSGLHSLHELVIDSSLKKEKDRIRKELPFGAKITFR